MAAAFPKTFFALRSDNCLTFSEAGMCSRFCISGCWAVLNKKLKVKQL
nr:MAG TPA: hypothetical protein [Caudoviricetes sp.]